MRTLMTIVVCFVFIAVAGCSGKTQQTPVAEVTFNFMGQMGVVLLHNDAIMLLAVTDDLYRHGIARPADVDRRQVVLGRFRHGVEYYGLQRFQRFIITEDEASRVVVTYPDGNILRERK